MHAILTYKMSNKRKGCINRDNNAVNNMISITLQYLKDRTRPEHFKRGVKIEDIKPKSDSNPEFVFNRTIRMY
jgi:hypothetical protein